MILFEQHCNWIWIDIVFVSFFSLFFIFKHASLSLIFSVPFILARHFLFFFFIIFSCELFSFFAFKAFNTIFNIFFFCLFFYSGSVFECILFIALALSWQSLEMKSVRNDMERSVTNENSNNKKLFNQYGDLIKSFHDAHEIFFSSLLLFSVCFSFSKVLFHIVKYQNGLLCVYCTCVRVSNLVAISFWCLCKSMHEHISHKMFRWLRFFFFFRWCVSAIRPSHIHIYDANANANVYDVKTFPFTCIIIWYPTKKSIWIWYHVNKNKRKKKKKNSWKTSTTTTTTPRLYNQFCMINILWCPVLKSFGTIENVSKPFSALHQNHVLHTLWWLCESSRNRSSWNWAKFQPSIPFGSIF